MILYASLTAKENQISSLKKNLEEMTFKVNKESQEKDNCIFFLRKRLEEMTNKANEETRNNFNLSTLLKENEKKLEILEKKDNKVDYSTLLNNMENIIYIQKILNNLDDCSDEYESHENCINYLKAEYEKLTCIINIEIEKKLDILEERVDYLEKVNFTNFRQ
ncbi:unnamed protein product [Rhizophagus irregularis]|uniref:Uncharacterized protein n=1 Tax=Rhizophagus irregularis TaxID=588596 RepID=A0A2N1MCE4_9GLOM|nr:hypothetical protein RhiirC2_795029 [Rhizophagus irregularis]CAB4381558.1 unnamed protein product [Rhizophagus irregularis]CAB5392278.1 unnamed protein product [Rhizophagus irregularis]